MIDKKVLQDMGFEEWKDLDGVWQFKSKNEDNFFVCFDTSYPFFYDENIVYGDVTMNSFLTKFNNWKNSIRQNKYCIVCEIGHQNKCNAAYELACLITNFSCFKLCIDKRE